MTDQIRMPNAQRGEVAIDIGGKPYIMCLTLGALATAETVLGINTAGELESTITRPTKFQLLTLLHCFINHDPAQSIAFDALQSANILDDYAYNRIIAAWNAAHPKSDTVGNVGETQAIETPQPLGQSGGG